MPWTQTDEIPSIHFSVGERTRMNIQWLWGQPMECCSTYKKWLNLSDLIFRIMLCSMQWGLYHECKCSVLSSATCGFVVMSNINSYILNGNPVTVLFKDKNVLETWRWALFSEQISNTITLVHELSFRPCKSYFWSACGAFFIKWTFQNHLSISYCAILLPIMVMVWNL